MWQKFLAQFTFTNFMLLMKSSPFIRHNVVFFAGSMIVGFLNYLYYPVLGRLLSTADFGEVQTLVSIFLQATIFLQVVSLVTVFVTVNYENTYKRSQILFGLEKLASIIGGSLVLLLMLFVDQLQEILKFESILPFFALGLALVVSILANFRIAYLRGVKQFGKASVSGGLVAGAKLLLSALFVVLGFRTFGAIAGIVLAQLIALTYTVKQASNYGLKGFGWRGTHIDFGELKPQLKYASLVFVVSLSVMLFLSIDIVAAKYSFSPELAGKYAGIVTVARIIFFLTASIAGVMLSLIKINSSLNANRLRLMGSLVLTCTLGSAALLFIYIFPEFSVRLLVGSKYLELAPLLPRLAVAVFLISVMNLLLQYNMALRRYDFGAIAIGGVVLLLVMLYFNSETPEGIVSSVLYGSFFTLLLTVFWTGYTELNARR